ncbi:hypothetical protein [Nonomuraea turcica]|uniref:hypothetical protein n=1 Tax=Nonomuraea sp. G32 TaxID=3067274 RepID=UPI00273BB350|nr:hypothetical protein [Nonomuraea sp. G32]MDP4503103.1 hypothetical protein [Nonomuraea sp. G32]
MRTPLCSVMSSSGKGAMQVTQSGTAKWLGAVNSIGESSGGAGKMFRPQIQAAV